MENGNFIDEFLSNLDEKDMTSEPLLIDDSQLIIKKESTDLEKLISLKKAQAELLEGKVVDKFSKTEIKHMEEGKNA